MAIKNQKSIDFLQNSSTLGLRDIVEKVNKIRQLNEAVQEYLEDRLKPHCRVMNYRQNKVIIAVDNATWGTLLRFQLPDLLRNLRQNPRFAAVASIDYHIRPPEKNFISPTPVIERFVSSTCVKNITDAAASIQDPALKATLLKFARYQNK
jgi:hypothetical protein